MTESEELTKIIADRLPGRDGIPKIQDVWMAQAILESTFLADHDRRIKAETLKSAANDLPNWMPGRHNINRWLWERAATIEKTPETS
ncbi:hypothetical protein [Subtercola endophyticus]|uniref:hypothetical protein n=1 Tax=Subtercola endophyticus TaxID=2895559 RepID=UPI001E296DF1|nr:hypothetical protein [Subtercola endophyticus]UFS59494.1 hypothetical protein LQ955_01445 [Subtercola endophyticus]